MVFGLSVSFLDDIYLNKNLIFLPCSQGGVSVLRVDIFLASSPCMA